jgi:hypothetical protein
VPGIDGEEVPAETIVPDVKEYMSKTIDDPEAIYDPKIWDAFGFALVLSWLAQKWNQRCLKLAPRGSKNPEQYLTKEQQKACLDSAAAELIRETHFADSSRTSPEVREVPKADICSAAKIVLIRSPHWRGPAESAARRARALWQS